MIFIVRFQSMGAVYLITDEDWLLKMMNYIVNRTELPTSYFTCGYQLARLVLYSFEIDFRPSH
jgi:hypothetical protein